MTVHPKKQKYMFFILAVDFILSDSFDASCSVLEISGVAMFCFSPI